MAGGPPISPYYYENRDANGNVNAAFYVYFDASLTLTSITAYNVQGSGLTQIVVLMVDGTTWRTFPLPTSGKKATLACNDAQGRPTTVQAYSASVSQSQINAQGFTVFSDITTYSVG